MASPGGTRDWCGQVCNKEHVPILQRTKFNPKMKKCKNSGQSWRYWCLYDQVCQDCGKVLIYSSVLHRYGICPDGNAAWVQA